MDSNVSSAVNISANISDTIENTTVEIIETQINTSNIEINTTTKNESIVDESSVSNVTINSSVELEVEEIPQDTRANLTNDTSKNLNSTALQNQTKEIPEKEEIEEAEEIDEIKEVDEDAELPPP